MTGRDKVLEGRIKRRHIRLARKQVYEEKQVAAEQHDLPIPDEEADALHVF